MAFSLPFLPSSPRRRTKVRNSPNPDCLTYQGRLLNFAHRTGISFNLELSNPSPCTSACVHVVFVVLASPSSPRSPTFCLSLSLLSLESLFLSFLRFYPHLCDSSQTQKRARESRLLRRESPSPPLYTATVGGAVFHTCSQSVRVSIEEKK